MGLERKISYNGIAFNAKKIGQPCIGGYLLVTWILKDGCPNFFKPSFKERQVVVMPHKEFEFLACSSNEWCLIELSCPIDWWAGSMTVSELIANIQSDCDSITSDRLLLETTKVLRDVERVLALCPYETEPDLGQEATVLTLPGDNAWIVFGYCYKLSNNGTTFVAVPNNLYAWFSWWLQLQRAEFSVHFFDD